uniref:Uncharacterized protein n=1 Tax=Leptobrachium leishanense TaxID=445787 RepID=A0A8C5PYL1_9ANUR
LVVPGRSFGHLRCRQSGFPGKCLHCYFSFFVCIILYYACYKVALKLFHYIFYLFTEQIGQGILENLSQDREKIQRARERLRETDTNLGKSSRILTGMLRR